MGLAVRIWTLDSRTAEPQQHGGAELAEPDSPAGLCDLEKATAALHPHSAGRTAPLKASEPQRSYLHLPKPEDNHTIICDKAPLAN